MARAPQLSRLSADDYPDAPEWFQQFVETLNPFVGDTTQALAGGLNKDNIARQYEKITVETRAFAADTFANGAVQIKNRLGTAPTAVLICQVFPQANVDFSQNTPHLVGATVQPAFTNTWSILGGQTPAAFYKDGSGLVHLEGVVWRDRGVGCDRGRVDVARCVPAGHYRRVRVRIQQRLRPRIRGTRRHRAGGHWL